MTQSADRAIPVYLRIGKNILKPEHFEIAARRLLPKQPGLRVVKPDEKRTETVLEVALRSGRFVVNGVEVVRRSGTETVAEPDSAA